MSNLVTLPPQYYRADYTETPPSSLPTICSVLGVGLGLTVAPLLIAVGVDIDNTSVLATGVAIATIGGLSLLFLTYQCCKPNKTAEGTALLGSPLATRINQLPRDSQERAIVPRDKPLQSHELV